MGIKNGDKVRLDYELRLESGQIIDSTKHEDHSHPFEFVVGSGNMIKGFEKNVIGMNKNQEKEFTVEPVEGYGESNPKLFQQIPKLSLPQEREPEVGMMLTGSSPDGHTFQTIITAVDKETVTVDLNHPLAGKKLIFKIKILDINSDTPLEHHHH